jgi:REP element-mobilizing transposase RayT
MALALIALALSKACREHPEIRVVAFTFLSNHYHMVVEVLDDRDAPKISKFLQTLNQTIAETLNKLLGRTGHFFRGKPKITAILDDTALFGRMTYTHTQAVHHGLVERAEEWLGLSSFRAVCDGKASVEVPHFDEAAWREAGGGRVAGRGVHGHDLHPTLEAEEVGGPVCARAPRGAACPRAERARPGA